MEKKNCVYIGASIDNYIADRDGGLAWLDLIPNPNNEDMGYFAFMEQIDALVMGRKTFDTVLGFDVEWPYKKPVFVLSNSLKSIPDSHTNKAFLVNGELSDVLNEIHSKGYYRLYIDGGKIIQSFLQEDLIDEMCITTIPILLGGGVPLFSDLPKELTFEMKDSKVLLGQLNQRFYKRKKDD